MKGSVCRASAVRARPAARGVNVATRASKPAVTVRPSLHSVALTRKPASSMSNSKAPKPSQTLTKSSRLYINTRAVSMDNKHTADHIAGGTESKAKPPKDDWEAKKNDGENTAPINSTRKESQSPAGQETREDPTKPAHHGGPSQENSIPVTGHQSGSQHRPDTLDKGKNTVNKSISIGGGKIDSDLGGSGGGSMGGVGGKGESPGGIDGGKIDPFPGSHRPKDSGLEKGGTRGGSGKSSGKDAPVASGVVKFSPFNFLRTRSAAAPPLFASLSFVPGFTHHITRALGYNLVLTRSPPRTPQESPSSPTNRPTGPGHTGPDTSSHSSAGPDKSSQSGSRPEWSETTKNRPEVAPNPPYAS